MPLPFRLAAALALAPVHAGMWLWEELSSRFCSRCGRWLSFLSAALAGMVLCGAALGLRWAMRKGIL